MRTVRARYVGRTLNNRTVAAYLVTGECDTPVIPESLPVRVGVAVLAFTRRVEDHHVTVRVDRNRLVSQRWAL